MDVPFTVMLISSEAVAPLSSVTVSLNVYEPTDNPIIVDDALFGAQHTGRGGLGHVPRLVPGGKAV